MQCKFILLWKNIDSENSPSPRYSFAFTNYIIDSNEYFAVFGGQSLDINDNNLYM